MIEAIAPDVNYISLLEKTPKLTIQYPTNTAEKGFTFLYCWEVPVAIMREGKVGGLYVVWVNSRTGEVIGGDFDWERMLIDR
jgi:hypothetical protein